MKFPDARVELPLHRATSGARSEEDGICIDNHDLLLHSMDEIYVNACVQSLHVIAD